MEGQVPQPRPGTTSSNLSADYALPSLRQFEGSTMYAVIRTGGKQYLVSPGEVLKIERTAHTDGAVEFSDVLAVSPEAGKFESSLSGAKVTGTVVGEGKGDKVLVFKLKRKKQYKKRFGHRQNFVQVRINEITVNGQSFKAE
ncbi:MAG TPA: 50S ribosomal protein L21 [Acidobacteriaceae bacterium]|nr:50S ribosomal protein L21 [Acidobacteriaceae bacterium]